MPWCHGEGIPSLGGKHFSPLPLPPPQTKGLKGWTQCCPLGWLRGHAVTSGMGAKLQSFPSPFPPPLPVPHCWGDAGGGGEGWGEHQPPLRLWVRLGGAWRWACSQMGKLRHSTGTTCPRLLSSSGSQPSPIHHLPPPSHPSSTRDPHPNMRGTPFSLPQFRYTVTTFRADIWSIPAGLFSLTLSMRLCNKTRN